MDGHRRKARAPYVAVFKLQAPLRDVHSVELAAAGCELAAGGWTSTWWGGGAARQKLSRIRLASCERR